MIFFQTQILPRLVRSGIRIACRSVRPAGCQRGRPPDSRQFSADRPPDFAPVRLRPGQTSPRSDFAPVKPPQHTPPQIQSGTRPHRRRQPPWPSHWRQTPQTRSRGALPFRHRPRPAKGSQQPVPGRPKSRRLHSHAEIPARQTVPKETPKPQHTPERNTIGSDRNPAHQPTIPHTTHQPETTHTSNSAEGGSRTHTPLRAPDFESGASAIPPPRLECCATRENADRSSPSRHKVY